MRTASLLAVLLVPLLTPLAGRAEDESPAARFDATVAAFPKPAPDRGFVAAGKVWAEGKVVGVFRVAARTAPLPESPKGPVHWLLSSTLDVTFQDVTLRDNAKAYVTAALAPVQGVLTRTDAWGETVRYTWRRAGDAFKVEMKSDVREAMSKSAAVEGSSLTTLAAFVLFARLAPSTDTQYETHTFDPGWNYLEAEQPFAPTAISSAVSQNWREHVMRLVTFAHRDGKVVVARALKDARIGGLEIHRKGRPNLVLVPGIDPGEGPEDYFADPSKTPKGCAMRVALAFVAADADVFEKVIHWPTLKTNMKAQISGNMTDEAFKKAILAQFEAHKEGGRPRDQSEASLCKMADDFTVEMRGKW